MPDARVRGVSVWLAVGVALCATPIAALAEKSTQVEQSNWLQHVAQQGAAQIHDAELAQSRALLPSIRALARRVANEERALGADLARLGVETRLEVGPTSEWSDARGPDFDRGYMRTLVTRHLATLQLLAHTAHASGEPIDSELESLRARMRTVLQGHLAEARAIGLRVARFGIDTGMDTALFDSSDATD